jgi:transposase
MNVHSLARTTPLSRAALVARIEVEGWSVAQAAAGFGVSERTATSGWLGSDREGPP